MYYRCRSCGLVFVSVRKIRTHHCKGGKNANTVVRAKTSKNSGTKMR